MKNIGSEMGPLPQESHAKTLKREFFDNTTLTRDQIDSIKALLHKEELIRRDIKGVILLGKVGNPKLISAARELLDKVKQDIDAFKSKLLEDVPTEDEYVLFIEAIISNPKILDAYNALEEGDQSKLYEEFEKLNKIKDIQQVFVNNLMVTANFKDLCKIAKEHELPILIGLLEAGQK